MDLFAFDGQQYVEHYQTKLFGRQGIKVEDMLTDDTRFNKTFISLDVKKAFNRALYTTSNGGQQNEFKESKILVLVDVQFQPTYQGKGLSSGVGNEDEWTKLPQEEEEIDDAVNKLVGEDDRFKAVNNIDDIILKDIFRYVGQVASETRQDEFGQLNF